MTKTRDLADLGGGFIQAGSGAEQRTVESKLQDVVSVLDFIPASEHAAIKAGTSTYNATAAIQAALSASPSRGIYFPNGTYLTDGGHTLTTQVVGESMDGVIIKRRTAGPALFNVSDFSAIKNLTIDGDSLNGVGVNIINASSGTYKFGDVSNLIIKNVGDQTTATKTITGVTSANPPVVTCVGHGYSTGDLVTIEGVTGVTSTEPGGAGGIGRSLVEGVWRITKLTNDTFSLDGLDATNFTAYSSGGTAQLASFALSIKRNSSATATLKNISNLWLEDNYGHIFVDWAVHLNFDNVSLLGQVKRDGIYLGLGVNNVYFKNLYMRSSGVRTAAYGIREVHFDNTQAYLRDDLGTWNYPWFSSLAFNYNSTIGGEVAGISFNKLYIQRLDLKATPLFDINNFDLFFDKVTFTLNAQDYSGKGLILDRGTARMSIKDLVVDSILGTWDLFHPDTTGGQSTVAVNVNYTQGTQGTITWSNTNEAGIAANRITVTNSNLKQAIDSLNPYSCRGYQFRNIYGNIDLTYAASGGTIVENCYGTITDPNNALGFQVDATTTYVDKVAFTGRGDIHQPVADRFIRISGGDGAGSGAYILAFGQSNGSAPGRLALAAQGAGYYTLNTGGTEKERINPNGDTYKYADFYGLSQGVNVAASKFYYIFEGKHSATSPVNGTQCIQIYANGDIENTNNAYGALSDIKLKENISDSGSQWDDIKALRIRKYNLKESTGHSTHTQIGLIAQEVEPICPGLVSSTPDRVTKEVPVLDEAGSALLDEEGNPVFDIVEEFTGENTKSINYSVLYMKAVKALQEAMERIEVLEAKVAAIETN